MLGQWEHDKRFLDKNGMRRRLTWQGDKNEFKVLAESVSKDINPGAMMFELQRVGAVSINGDFVEPKKLTYDQHRSPEKGLNLFFRDVESIGRAVEENLLRPEKLRNLHIRTFYDNISKKDLPVIRKWFLKQGSRFHKLARDFLSRYDKDLNPDIAGECNSTVVFTTYSWTEGIDDMPAE